MARLINDTGILGDTIVELSTMTQKGNFEEVVSFDVVIEAIHQVQEEMNITGTTMEEASGTIEGSINTMKAAWSNWQAGLADPDANMSALTDNLVNSFETTASNVIPAVQRIGDSIGEMFTDITGIDLTPVTSVFDELRTSLTEIGAAFAEGGVGGGFEAITAQIEQLTGFDLSGIVDTFAGIGEAFAEIGAAFAEGGIGGGFEAIVNALESATGLDLTGLVDGVTGFIDGLKAIDPESLQKVAQSVGVFIENFKDSAIADLMQTIVDGVGDFFDKLGEISPGVIDTIAESIKKFADNFEKIAPWILAAAGAILSFVTAVAALNGIPAIISAVVGAFTALNTALAVITANPVTAIITAIVAIGTALVTAYHTCEEFRNGVNRLFDVLSGAFSILGETLADIPRGIRESVGEMGAAISELVGIIKSKISEFAQAGRDLIAGFVNGVTEKLASAKEAITGAFGKVTEWVKGVFDVHSPSRVFAEIGRNLMRGLSVGVDDEAGVVQDSINKLRFTVPPISTGKVDFANSAIGRTTSAMMTGMMAAGGSSGGAMNINLNVDGRTMASVLFDPLNNIIRQKGVTLGAQN